MYKCELLILSKKVYASLEINNYITYKIAIFISTGEISYFFYD